MAFIKKIFNYITFIATVAASMYGGWAFSQTIMTLVMAFAAWLGFGSFMTTVLWVIGLVVSVFGAGIAAAAIFAFISLVVGGIYLIFHLLFGKKMTEEQVAKMLSDAEADFVPSDIHSPAV
jgi:hypothetical protein